MRNRGWVFGSLLLVVGCKGGGDASEESGSSEGTGTADSLDGPTSAPSTSSDATSTSGPHGSSDEGGSSDDGTDTGGPVHSGCDPLPEPDGDVIEVGPDDDLAAAIQSAPNGSTVMIADGTYMVGAQGLWVGADDVTIRGASGDRDAVILDGDYQQQSGGLLNVSGRTGTTIAHLSIRRARYHTIHVTGGTEGPSSNTRMYDLHLSDPGEQAVKINSNHGFDSDEGEVACSLIELTDAGREQVMMYESSGTYCYTGGIDAHRAWNWVIRDNVIRGFWCSNEYLSEHGIHFWRGGRDTLVERNLLVDNARAIGFGLGQPAGGRTYDDEPCPGLAAAEHYGGTIRNNMIIGTRPELFTSPSGMDLGIGLEAACEVVVAHNTVASTQAPFSSIEWRWAETTARLVNNLVTHNLRERDGASAVLVSNLENADPALFVDLAGEDVHLTAEATAAIDQGDPQGSSEAPEDYDRDLRDGMPDIGADEYVP